jgi:Fic family protein
MNYKKIKEEIQKIIPNKKKAIFYCQNVLSDFVYDAISLEGIKYTAIEVKTLLNGVTIGGHKLSDQQITLNQAHAWQYMFDALKENKFNLTSEFVLNLHNILAKEEALAWGKFRTGGVTISGTKYVPPVSNPIELERKWEMLTEKEPPNTKNIKEVYDYAINLFLQMAKTQFFFDCNKRTGRMMMNGILLSRGLPAISVSPTRELEFLKHLVEYYEDKNNKTKQMQKFILSCLDSNIIQFMQKTKTSNKKIGILNKLPKLEPSTDITPAEAIKIKDKKKDKKELDR